MKCPKCGKVWNELNIIASNTYICPFCGDNFGMDGDKREDINQIVKKIVDEYGIELLQNVNRVNALLMDYAPHSEKERKLIIMVMREGILSQLIKLKNESEDNQKFGINKCIKHLVADIWITEIAARYAVMMLANAIGISVKIGFSDEYSIVEDSDMNNNREMIVLSKEMELTSEEAIKTVLVNCEAVGYKALAANTSLEKISLPDSIISIYPKAFLNCINLKTICLPRRVKNIGTCVFEGCTALEEIVTQEGANFKVIDGVLIDRKTKKALRVENHANMDKVFIANGITTICKKSFDYTEVNQISIPMSVDTIEENAFYMTMNLQNFYVDSKNLYFRAIDGVLHDRKGVVLLRYPQGKSGVNYYLEDTVEEIGLQAFSYTRNIQTITLTSALKKIGSKAFEYCLSLENIMLPGRVEIIGDRAFQYCEKLRSIMLASNIREIGDCAFYNCISLESISVPRSVERIGNHAFAKCKKLRNVKMQENITFIGDGAFVGCEGIEIFVKNNPYVETYCHSHGITCNKV